MLGKKGELSTGWIIAIIVAVVLLLDIGGAGTWAKGLVGVGDTTPSTGQAAQVPVSAGQASKCYIEDTTVSVGPAEKRYAPATKATGEYHQVIKNGVDKGKLLDGTTLTANPGDKLEIYYAINSDQNPNSGYYAAKQIFTVPCVGEVTTAEAPDSDAYQIFASDSNNLTINIYNWNNGNVNSRTDNLTLGAGDKKSNKMEIFGTYQQGFSPYGKTAIVIIANETTYKDFAIGEYPRIPSPTHVKPRGSLGSEAKEYGFELPGVRSNEEIITTLYIEVKPTPGDASVLETEGNQLSLIIVDQDWYQDTVTGDMAFGYEDNDYADIGLDDINKTVTVK